MPAAASCTPATSPHLSCRVNLRQRLSDIQVLIERLDIDILLLEEGKLIHGGLTADPPDCIRQRERANQDYAGTSHALLDACEGMDPVDVAKETYRFAFADSDKVYQLARLSVMPTSTSSVTCSTISID
ncbi:hypothetical protein HKX48_006781 [Thoreauomyces humboldtii]|nr:hypothetical protein HKX48_006781 [Thoreauomyces humboldtii]